MPALRLILSAAAARLLAAVACLALLVMVILTFVDVIGRYGFNNSVFGASELVELLMVGVVFGGFAFVTASGQHISVTLFDHLLSARAPRLLQWVKFLFSLLIYGLLVFILWRMTLEAFANGRQSIVLALPVWLFPGGAAFLSSLGLALCLLCGPPAEGSRDD